MSTVDDGNTVRGQSTILDYLLRAFSKKSSVLARHRMPRVL
jgi:hypothetical protein